MPINLISKIKPKNDGSFPVYEDIDVEGGYQVRTDLTDRNSIPSLNRKIGMLVYVQSEEKYYTLSVGITDDDWIEAQLGGGGFTAGGDLSGTSTNQTVIGLNTVPLPVELPVDSDMLKAEAQLLLSEWALGSCTDGYNIWVADTQDPDIQLTDYQSTGGIVRVEYANDYISTRFSYNVTSGLYSLPISVYSVAYLDGYLYATGIEKDSYETSHPSIYKIDPNSGIVLDSAYTSALSYVYTAGSTLWITSPFTENYQLYKVDPLNISSQTSVWDDATTAYIMGFTYDPIEDRIWVSSNAGDVIVKINPNTSAIDFTNEDYNDPSGLAYGNGYIWLITGVQIYYGCVSYIISGLTTIYALEKTAGNIANTILDPNGMLVNTLLISYDETNNKFWVPCNTYPSPRVTRIDAETYTVDGVASLEYETNTSIIAAGGYVWIVDNSSGGGYSILKIDPALVVDIFDLVPYPPWNGLIAAIKDGPPVYVFIQKNSATTVNYTYAGSGITVKNKEEIILAPNATFGYSTVTLPATPEDGQKHTIIDAQGGAASYNIRVYDSEYNLQFFIANPYGAVTLVWSEDRDRWYIISYYPQELQIIDGL